MKQIIALGACVLATLWFVIFGGSPVSAGRTLYKLRKQTVEAVFGIIKEVLGFRRFLLRGREKFRWNGCGSA